MITCSLRIHGRVQGVGYRAWTVRNARELGLSGWVRNRADGTVEAILHGPDEAVRTMIGRCAEGPSFASVTKIEESECAFEGGAGFEARATV